MTSPVTAQYLLEGAAYALEQCGLLLRDANALFRSGSYATTIALAASAREELRRSVILLGMWKEALVGRIFTIEDVEAQCDVRLRKQDMGKLSADAAREVQSSSLARSWRDWAARARLSVASQPASAGVEAPARRTQTSAPNRQESSTAALFVEPKSDTEWNRPADRTRYDAAISLSDAVTDYSSRYDSWFVEPEGLILQHTNRELYNALEQWSERPKLPRPEWPTLRALHEGG